MDADDVPNSLGSAAGGAVEPRTVLGRWDSTPLATFSAGESDDTAEQDDLDTWWAFTAGRRGGI